MVKKNSKAVGRVLSTIMAAVLAITTIFVSGGSKVLAANFAWTAASEVLQSTLDHVDLQPGIVKVGNDVFVVFADPSSDSANPWKVYKGTSIDNVTYQYTGTRNNFPTDYSDYRFWNTGIWVDTTDNNKWYTLVHCEYYYGGQGDWPMRKIGYATSTDSGRNWYWQYRSVE